MRSLGFHPAVCDWFESRFGDATEPQLLGWPAIRAGGDVLIAAPTGSGKTLAAFLAALDDLFVRGMAGELPAATQVLYVSPLKALSNDIHKNLEEPLGGIRDAFAAAGLPTVEVRSGVRTGDTSSAERSRMRQRPPHVLVTTPESLYLLLTSEGGRAALKGLRTVIVDEIHAVAGNRRGAHLALSLERLDRLVGRPLQRIGLSATQKPIEEIARFLVGAGRLDAAGAPRCAVVDATRPRALDLKIELPSSPLEAVMPGEVWDELHRRLADLVAAHRTTLIFVNTRRMAERLTAALQERVGKEAIRAHHGSLSMALRHEAEQLLKAGALRALVATASLEMGIDIGTVDLVAQVGSTRSIANAVQRIGRSGHFRFGTPKGRIFPTSRDELIECAALTRCIGRGELDRVVVPRQPLDVLAQQIVAIAACEELSEDELGELVRRAYPYRGLEPARLEAVVAMLADGFSTRRGRRSAHLHHDGVNRRIRGRKGARLTALLNGGAIPENADYRVELEPEGTFIGTLNEDFAIESMPGDIFQLGNTSWQITRVQNGVVRVRDAAGQPPTLPFWLGEAPARSDELSAAVSALRAEAEAILAASPSPAAGLERLRDHLAEDPALPREGAVQIAEYFTATRAVLGHLPTQERIVMERFFDESGGMQLVIHSPFGGRINRAWGLALRKRFCRSFNFELQAAANEDALVLSLGETHSFPLDDVARYLGAHTVRDVLVQALLDAPMFQTRWRWNANRSLAVPRRRAGGRVPANLQRMDAEDLIAVVFPDQLACVENIQGDRQIPDHPLVFQAIDDCLVEAMDIDGLVRLLDGLEHGRIACVTRDLPEPSPAAHEILSARPYAFLDDAPLEERRTRAVFLRRGLDVATARDLGALDTDAIAVVCQQAWPSADSPDEAHDALMLLGFLPAGEAEPFAPHLGALAAAGRAGRVQLSSSVAGWVATERWPMLRAVDPAAAVEPELVPPARLANVAWDAGDARRELVRGQLEARGPVTAAELAALLGLGERDVDAALLALEAEGFVLRGAFRPGRGAAVEWCERRLLARIHRRTLDRLRAEVQPCSPAELYRFLFAWQHVDPERRTEGQRGLAEVLRQLDGYELAAGAWEPEVLGARLTKYESRWLDQLCLAGEVAWGRFSRPAGADGRSFAAGPLRSSPMALFQRDSADDWLRLAARRDEARLTGEARRVEAALRKYGALFFAELVRATGLVAGQVEAALGELSALGYVTADSFAGLRALLGTTATGARLRADRPRRGMDGRARRGRRARTSRVEAAGRWSLLGGRVLLEPVEVPEGAPGGAPGAAAEPAAPAGVLAAPERWALGDPELAESIEAQAWVLLRRYGVVFRRLVEAESLAAPWRDLARVYRRLEARGEIRGGRFVTSFSGEQFALPEAVTLLRSLRRQPGQGRAVVLSAADPLNLTGILTPTRRVPATPSNRILFVDGRPVAALEGGEVHSLGEVPSTASAELDVARMLRRGAGGLDDAVMH